MLRWPPPTWGGRTGEAFINYWILHALQWRADVYHIGIKRRKSRTLPKAGQASCGEEEETSYCIKVFFHNLLLLLHQRKYLLSDATTTSGNLIRRLDGLDYKSVRVWALEAPWVMRQLLLPPTRCCRTWDQESLPKEKKALNKWQLTQYMAKPSIH